MPAGRFARVDIQSAALTISEKRFRVASCLRTVEAQELQERPGWRKPEFLPTLLGPTLDDEQIHEGFARFLAQAVTPKSENFFTQLALLFASDKIRDALNPNY